MHQPAITAQVAKLVLQGRGFQRTRGLARRLGCQPGQVVAAFDAVQAANPGVSFTRVYGAEAGGMGRA